MWMQKTLFDFFDKDEELERLDKYNTKTNSLSN
jgi:hypothetical protein